MSTIKKVSNIKNMSNEQHTPNQNNMAKAIEINKYMRKLTAYKKEFRNAVFPFDFTGNEPNDTLWPLVNFLIEKGYLTNELQPTELSLQKDYIRYNDGNRHYEELDEQPTLLFTGHFLLYSYKKYRNQFPLPLKPALDEKQN
jgi:hypothetical protein